MKVELTKKQIDRLLLLLKCDIEEGRRAIYQNPNATILIAMWEEDLILDKEIQERLNKLQ